MIVMVLMATYTNMMHRQLRKVALPQRVFKEDNTESLSSILGEGYRASKANEEQSFSSSEDDPPLFAPPTHTKNTLSVNLRAQAAGSKHKRSRSEISRLPPAPSVPVIPRLVAPKPDSDSEEMSESERIIRNIIKARKLSPREEKLFHSAQEESKDSISRVEPRQEKTEPVPIGFEKRISSILGDIEGERKHEELKRWQVKQHLLELLGSKQDLSQYDEVFYESDVKKSREELSTQKFTEGLRTSEASNATITGPGSSFLINENYERKKPIPEFHQCAKTNPVPRRNRSISTHCKEEKHDPDPGRTLRLALEKLLAGFRRVKEAVFQNLQNRNPEEIVLLLRPKAEDGLELLGLYERAGEGLARIYPQRALPGTIALSEVSIFYRLDPISATYKRVPGGRPDAVSLEGL